MKNPGLIFFLPLILAFSVGVNADLPTAQFLLEGQGPRAVAMGQSVVASAGDYTAWYWNPAAAAYATNPQAGFNGQKITQNISSSYLSFLYPLKHFTLGLEVLSENSSVAAYDNTGQQLPSINNQNITEDIGLAIPISNSLAVGADIGTVSMNVGGYNTNSAISGTIGLLYDHNRFSAAAVVANEGDKLTFAKSNEAESQPTLTRYGLSYAFLPQKTLICCIAKQDVTSGAILSSISGGAEYLLGKYFALRAGILNQNGYIRTSYGFGVIYKHIGLDFSYTTAPEELQGMDAAQFGLSYRFEHANRQLREEESNQSKDVAIPQLKEDEQRPLPQGQRNKVNVAVSDFAGKNTSAADASIVADFLRTDLVNDGEVNVVDKANMDKILAEAAFQQTGCTASECAVQIGKLLNVRQMIVGSLSKLMGTYFISVNLVDVETSKILKSETAKANSPDELQSACKQLATKLTR